MKTSTQFLLMLLVLACVGCSGSPTALVDPPLLLPTLEVVATRTMPPPSPASTETVLPTASPTLEPTATSISATSIPATSIPATSIPASSTPAQLAVYHNAFAVGFSVDGSRFIFNAGNYEDESMFEAGRDRAYLYQTESGEVSRIGATGNRAASFSADGRFVMLYGRSNALEPLADHESYYILVDMETGQEERVDFSALDKELYGSTYAYLSPDGQTLALTFFNNSGRGDVDIYLQGRASGERVKITEGSGAGISSKTSYYPTFSPDGGWLVFLSSAADLVEGDQSCSEANPNCFDIFVYEISTGRMERIPANINLAMGTPTFRLAVTNDARWIAWADVEETEGNFRFVIRLHDRQTGATETICGADERCSAHTPVLSADGRWLAYVANEDGNTNSQVYLLDRHSGGRSMISVDEMGLPGDAQSGTIHMQSEGFNSDLQISGDGRFVAFSSQAANLLPEGAEKRQCLDPVMLGEYACYDLFVFDREAGELRWISLPE